MHVHYQSDESLTVISGRIGYQVPGGEKKFAGPGETVLFKAGTPHKFWNAGTELCIVPVISHNPGT
jgi:Mannose-6-phosphate isomerase